MKCTISVMNNIKVYKASYLHTNMCEHAASPRSECLGKERSVNTTKREKQLPSWNSEQTKEETCKYYLSRAWPRENTNMASLYNSPGIGLLKFSTLSHNPPS